VHHIIWFFQKLDVANGKAQDVELLFRDSNGNDIKEYFAHEAHWNGEFWKLTGVREISGPGNTIKGDYAQMDLPDVTTPPRQLSLIVSEAQQLTVPQLSQYIATSTSTQEHLAGYRTEWWYRILHPFSLIVLLLFALLNGMHTDRRGAATGVAWTIAVLVLYTFCMATLMPFGQHNRMPPFLAAVATEVIFGAIGLHLLALKYGWYWQLRNWGKPIRR
jgi:lipopolysaccharide export LptBFGC system permease protein LptF